MKLISHPTEIQAPGLPPKIIQEFIGLLNSKTDELSIARMNSPTGWSEPWQICDFNEYIYVLNGTMVVETVNQITHVNANQVILVEKGEKVRYSTPFKEGAQYLAICCPAFSLERVRRE
jgi:mannose-6-phosphate isomerase-like protein (cupin superfamily)